MTDGQEARIVEAVLAGHDCTICWQGHRRHPVYCSAEPDIFDGTERLCDDCWNSWSKWPKDPLIDAVINPTVQQWYRWVKLRRKETGNSDTETNDAI